MFTKSPGYALPLAAAIAALMALSPHFAMVAYAAPPSIPSSLEVAVSYADTERTDACTNCFPNPWCGSPGVQFVGSSTNYNGNPNDAGNCAKGDWDTGAILVTNTGAAPITLTGLTVALPLPSSGNPGSPTCTAETRPLTIDIWFGQQYYYNDKSTPAYLGGPIIVPPGGQAIFAGTSSDGTYKCPSGNYPSGPTSGTYDFDSSDAYFLDWCIPSTDAASAPRITFVATGYAATAYTDVGHTIDTGGIDTGNCSSTPTNPGWPNEELGWRVASSTCGEGCPTNQYVVPQSSSSSAVTTIGTTAANSEGTNTTTIYAVAAVAVIVIVAAGFLALRRRPAG